MGTLVSFAQRSLRQFVNSNRSICRSLENRFTKQDSSTGYRSLLLARINAAVGPNTNSILEVGGIDRPLLRKSPQYRYLGLDLDATESCERIYDTFMIGSIESPLKVTVDMIISITLLEHVPDNRSAMRSIFNGLNPGGSMHHYLPSANHPYAICLRLVGPRLQRLLIRWLRPGSQEVTGYPAYFDHCTPRKMLHLCESTGFQQIQVKSLYDASDYFAFFVPCWVLAALFDRICRTLRLSAFCSGFVLSASHPRNSLSKEG